MGLACTELSKLSAGQAVFGKIFPVSESRTEKLSLKGAATISNFCSSLTWVIRGDAANGACASSAVQSVFKS